MRDRVTTRNHDLNEPRFGSYWKLGIRRER